MHLTPWPPLLKERGKRGVGEEMYETGSFIG